MAPTNKKISKTEVEESKAKVKGDESEKKSDSPEEADDLDLGSQVNNKAHLSFNVISVQCSWYEYVSSYYVRVLTENLIINIIMGVGQVY